MPASIADKIKRLFASTEELEARELREQSKGCGAQQLDQCQPRSRVTLRGNVIAITTDARNGRLEADLSDGSGTVRLIWMGRTRLSCVLPGCTLQVSGRLAGDAHHPVIYNPDYEVIGRGHSADS